MGQWPALLRSAYDNISYQYTLSASPSMAPSVRLILEHTDLSSSANEIMQALAALYACCVEEGDRANKYLVPAVVVLREWCGNDPLLDPDIVCVHVPASPSYADDQCAETASIVHSPLEERSGWRDGHCSERQEAERLACAAMRDTVETVQTLRKARGLKELRVVSVQPQAPPRLAGEESASVAKGE